MSSNKKPRVIAYYLPQFHPIPENDVWWGKGFTEWTNVGKAKPLFKNHYQPRIPADLGYYDLRLPEVRDAQAQLAKEAGVYGFCYWHYWFGNGKQLLETPINQVLQSKQPDFPFCMGWANETWKAKQWKLGASDTSLIEQQYLGIEDYKKHFKYSLKAFNDDRYIKINNKPLFLIYKPNDIPDDFIHHWNIWAKENGFENGLHFIARITDISTKEALKQKGFNAFTTDRYARIYHNMSKINKLVFRIKKIIKRQPLLTINYKDVISYLTNETIDSSEDVYPSILPNWDHSPRSGRKACIFHNSSPELFEKHASKVLDIVNKKSDENKIAFLKSWNEWAEGNYMEPDLKYGKGYILSLKKVLDTYSKLQ